MKCKNNKCDKDLSKQQEKGGQQFCSRSCSNSGIPRLLSKESKEKVSKSLTGIKRSNYESSEKVCLICTNTFIAISKSRNNKTCSRKCSYLLRSRLAAETKTLNGTHSGWHNRKGEPSYPEKYFISLFENKNITGWQREKKVGRWFIDFAFDDKMIALEIDGRQHDDPERKASDAVKDKYLTSLGWKVFRIKWFNPVSEENRKELHYQINEFFKRFNDDKKS